ncbi:hypothetical protein Bxe_A3087 [Paraburkholderia xenovorans LB400]|uniref:Uncharacterized protein n=1 Tax=Paraburkholderia xenovorans (strain LB400) TaxID=266265 RepID=Q141U7_PARXL|nr:hypothetical protein Bxe_A3087 [Paraburkholderia xenovorans LB400]
MTHHTLRLTADASGVGASVQLLSELAKRFPEVVERFVDGLLDLSELVRVDVRNCTAGTAGEVRICLEPSDCFREFLAAVAAGNVDGLVVEVDGHGCSPRKGD